MAGPLRVLLVSANTEKLPDPVFPLGAAYMAAVAEQHGHRVETVDLCFLDGGSGVLETKNFAGQLQLLITGSFDKFDEQPVGNITRLLLK